MNGARRIRLNLYVPATTGRRRHEHGRWRRALRRLAPTWESAPLRRLVQVACLALFLGLFFIVGWPYAADTPTGLVRFRERVPLELFLWLDPLVGLSTAVAARHWDVALLGGLAMLVFGLVFPRGFCGYLCPLGTLIDGFDWLVSRRVRWLRIERVGRWANLRYALLLAILVSSVGGALVAGYLAAIPVLTRGLMFSAGQAQLGLRKDWAQVGPLDAGVIFSLILFAAVFLLGLLVPRFWCRYVCPSGALLSVFNLLRLTERKVTSACISCNKCVEACPFDAIREDDFGTRTDACTFCQTCGGVCPTHAIQFVGRWDEVEARPPEQASGPAAAADVAAPDLALRTGLSRRAVLASAVGGAAAALAVRADPGAVGRARLLRPPGSVPEDQFLDLCIRCGECFKVCPGPVLHPAGFSAGLDALWTPVAVPTHAGCHPECNFCTQVCPTRAIRPLTLEEKRRTVMGLAVIDPQLCLPHRGERDCQLCYDECEAAGYHAIEMRPVQLDLGDAAAPPPGVLSEAELEEMSRINAPFVKADACVGCGLCEYRCHAALVRQQHLIPRSAVTVVAP